MSKLNSIWPRTVEGLRRAARIALRGSLVVDVDGEVWVSEVERVARVLGGTMCE